MGTQDSLGVPAQAPSGSPLQPAVSAAIPNAVDELRKAIRLLNNAAYKCGDTDGRDASITLQQRYADANEAALARAMAAVDAAMTEAYAEGRNDQAEEGAADAKRYRWLVENSFDKPGLTQVHCWLHTWEPHSQTGEPTEWLQRVRGPALDRCIDAAISRATGTQA